jgi:acetyltransferase-like isoleucine patch superfamily enzyme
MVPQAKKTFFVHPQALCDSDRVGQGTRIWAFSHVLAQARIGRDCNLGEHVFVENDVRIGDGCTIKNGVAIWDRVVLEDHVFVGPNAVFTNDLRPRAFIKRGAELFLPTIVCQGATIGANATIVCGITIGAFAMIGAGAVVTRDVPAHTLVAGNPARPLGRICFCGTRLDPQDSCSACGLPLARNSLQKCARA